VLRRLALIAVVLVGIVAPAQAAPSAVPADGASLAVQLTTPRGTYLLRLLAGAPSQGGEAMLRMRLEGAGGAAVRLAGRPASLKVEDGQAELRARVGRVPLRVVWQAGSSTLAVSTGVHDAEDSDARGWSIVGMGGTARVWLGGVGCTTEAGVLGSSFAYDTAGYGAPLGSGLGLDLRGARCSTPPGKSVL